MTRWRTKKEVPMCTQDRLVRLSSEVARLGMGWRMTVPMDRADDEWVIHLAGVPGQPPVVDVVANTFDDALDVAIGTLSGTSAVSSSS